MPTLTDEQVETYEREGWLVLRGAVPDAALQSVRDVFAFRVDETARRWHEDGLIQDMCERLPFEQRWAAIREQRPPRSPTSWRRALASRPVYELWQLPEILGPIRRMLGDEVFAHGIWNGRPREPKTDDVQRINWHQDAHYYTDWRASDGKLITVWIPLIDVSAETGALQVLPRSHTRGMIPPIRDHLGLFTVESSESVGEPVTLEMSPGDVVFFADTTLHCSLPNVSDVVRWSIDIRFGEATPEIMSKSDVGYVCHSADPSKVESFDTWIRRYDYDTPPEFPDIDRTAIATALGLTRMELEWF